MFSINTCLGSFGYDKLIYVLDKFYRLSFSQLQVLQLLLSAQNPIAATDLGRKTKIKGKSLGAILSSLSRTRFRNLSLITPAGQEVNGNGLRWQVNSRIGNLEKAKKTVNHLLKTYV